MPRDRATTSRRLSTPIRGPSRHAAEARSAAQDNGSARQSSRGRLRSRSRHAAEARSRVGSGDSARRLRSRSRGRSLRRSPTSLSLREKKLERERERLNALENEVSRARNRLSSKRRYSPCSRESSVHRENHAGSNRHLKNNRNNYDNVSNNAEQPVRSSSVSFSVKDIAHLLSSIKQLASQPSTNSPMNRSGDSKNILAEFNPSLKNQRIDVWLKKVNECASVYGWDERTTIHHAMQKLQGLAKTWYESLNSILYTWPEWQEKLLSAFPFEQNYGQALEEMLKRRSRYNEPIENYFYDKLALLNQCDIFDKRAVDCIIYGIGDKSLKSAALALRCSHPDQLLQYLMSSKDNNVGERVVNSRFRSSNESDLANAKPTTKTNGSSNIHCFNCKEKGHIFSRCPKPLITCTKCNKVGHSGDKCYSNSDSNKAKDASKTLLISASKPNSKFIKIIKINGRNVKSFIDFGSEVSLITESLAVELGLQHDRVQTVLKGFGNELVQSVGKVNVELSVDDVLANITCRVVSDKYLDVPVLVGQTFTEQPHVVVHKTATDLQFMNVDDEMPFSQNHTDRDNVVKVGVLNSVMLCGRASVRVSVEPRCEGYIMLNSKLLGKPHQQCVVAGGLHLVKHGRTIVDLTPLSSEFLLPLGSNLGRAVVVKVVNRVLVPDASVSSKVSNGLDISQIRVGESVTNSDRSRLFDLLQKYRHCFASSLEELGCTNVVEMSIEVNSKTPVVYRPYRLAHSERQKVREMVDDMLGAGIIRESASEYASPIVLIRKKDGKLRLCIDYRMLNSITVKERYPMPIIEDEIARLSGQACFISLDLASGYYQVPIAEDSKPLTSFVTPDGQYEFNRMPFGLANAPAVFQRMMNKVLGSARFYEATAYLDDLLIYGTSVDNCLVKLEHMLKLLEKANLTLNLTKCEFLKDKLDYLGYEISSAGVRPGMKKIQSVTDFPRPSNQHGVRQFLGLASYFRKFIQDFALVAHPLSKLLKKNVTWLWSCEQEQAFNSLKEKLVSRPVLAIYDPSAETELHTDASRVGIGGILLQRSFGSKSFNPVAFYSRQTSPEEKNFHSYELETLAVICSLKKFRVYLLGQKFKIVSDCGALRTTFTKRDLIPRIARWWLMMQEFECVIEYRPGVKMSHVDALSRNPQTLNQSSEVDIYPTVMLLNSDDWLLTLQLGDSELNRIRDILHTKLDPEGLKYIKDNYIIKDNGLYKRVDGDPEKLRWVVPKGARWQLCRLNHDDIGHLGVEKTIDRIRGTYWFPRMTKFVKKYVNACLECAYSKKRSNRSKGLLHPIPKIEIPFHTLHIDHLGPFVKSKKGNSYLLVVVDAFTKFVFIKPVRNTKTLTAINVLLDIFDVFRPPDRIISDRGTCFTSHAFKRFCTEKGIKHVLNAVASPQSNGQVERYNRTILNSLTAQNLGDDERVWDTKVGKIQWGLNNTVQKTTGRTPADVMFGTHMSSEIDPRLNEIRQTTRDATDLDTIREQVKDRIDEEQTKQKHRYDKNKRPARTYAIGDLVKITKTSFSNDGKSKKLNPAYVGPYRVVSLLGNDRYELAAIPGLSTTKNKRKTVVAANRMLPWVHVAALELYESSTDDDEIDKVSSD